MSNRTETEGKSRSYIASYVSVAGMKIPVIGTKLTLSDYWGAFKARCNFGRMNYRVPPGLYAVGNPDSESPVLVSANYKLTFDTLRKNLSGLDAWIVILDTKGINVWCAAGKGTFGTKELITRILSVRLFDVVSHRRVVVPQLGAPGISAHVVLERTGFRVWYGPVRARDVKRYLADGMKKDAVMSRVEFTMFDRIVLIPVELVNARYYFLILAFVSLVAGILAEGFRLDALYWMMYILGGLVSGAVLSPVLLPFVPAFSFTVKGSVVGLLLSLVLTFILGFPLIKAVPLTLIAMALSGYTALQFTGASTYTSENGVRKEIKVSLPVVYGVIGVSSAVALVYIITALVKRGGIS